MKDIILASLGLYTPTHSNVSLLGISRVIDLVLQLSML